MKYKIKLTDEQLDWLNNALIGACYYELEYLKYPKYAENRGNNPGVQAVKENLIRYLSLRRELIVRGAQAEGRETEVYDEAYWHIVDEWNQEIKRLKAVASPKEPQCGQCVREEGSENVQRDQCADD